jgi:rare lipoprotein A (peptidoglycan hydrolase)
VRLLLTIAIAASPAWMCLHVDPAAAQTFDERWSIIPNAHAEPAPAAPEEKKPAAPAQKSLTPDDRTPAGAEEKKTDVQTRPLIGGDSVPGSDERSPARASKRVFFGKVSYYSYHSGKTASGTSFDRNSRTAAHRSLPFGTKLRVTDLATNRSVVVVITDRGPSIRDRVLDLSLGAARSLGITERGVAHVRVEVL